MNSLRRDSSVLGLSAYAKKKCVSLVPAIDRLTVKEELRFLDQAYGQDGRTDLMLQTLLETGARVSELVQLRIEDVSLAERVITIRQGKGGKRGKCRSAETSHNCFGSTSAPGAPDHCSSAVSRDQG